MKCVLCTLLLTACTAPLHMSTPLQIAALDEKQAPHTIRVTGTGSAKATPDTARLRIGVAHEAESAKEAQARVARVAQALLGTWQQLGLPETAIRTQELTIHPIFSDPKPDGSPRITGYRARELFVLEFKDLTLMGPAIDQAIQAGANEWHGIEFVLKDDDQAQQSAIQKAMQDAQKQAEAALGAAGLTRGKVVRISVGASGMAPPMPMMAIREAAAGGTPVPPGQVEINAQVEVEYAF